MQARIRVAGVEHFAGAGIHHVSGVGGCNRAQRNDHNQPNCSCEK